MIPEHVARIIEAVVNYLRRENIRVTEYEVKERKSKYEIVLKLDRNIMGISLVRIICSKQPEGRIRVFTTLTSLDLRLKRIITRELEKAKKHENAL